MADALSQFFSSYNDLNKEQEISVLKSFLEGDLAATEAAERITAPASDRRQPSSDRVGKIWELLLACAEEVPDAQNQILDLFKAIFLLPKPQGKKTWEVDWSNEAQREGLSWTLEGLHGCKFYDLLVTWYKVMCQ